MGRTRHQRPPIPLLPRIQYPQPIQPAVFSKCNLCSLFSIFVLSFLVSWAFTARLPLGRSAQGVVSTAVVSDQPSVVAWVLARRGSVLGSREGFWGASALGVGFRGVGAAVGF